MADGSAAVDVEGTVSVGAIKSALYLDRLATVSQSNPVIADTQGLVQFYSPRAEVHIQIVTPNGVTYGIPWYPIENPQGVTLEADDFSSIQAAIDALPINGGVVQLGAGYYNITTPILFPTDRAVWLRGVGPANYQWGYGSIIHNVAPSTDQDSIRIRSDHQRVSDLAIVYNSTTGPPTGIGIVINSPARVLRRTTIEHVSIIGSGSWGVKFCGVETSADGRLSILSTLDHVDVSHNRADGGILIETGCTTIKLNECVVTDWAGIGLQLLGSDLVNVDSCTFEDGGTGNPIMISGGNTANRSTTINSCYFEEATGSSVHFITINAGVVMSPIIRGGIFIRSNAGINYIKAVKVNIATCYNLLIENLQGHAAFINPYVATDDISIGAGSSFATIIGAILKSQTGASIAYYKMSVLDAGTGTTKLGTGV
jgi:hypothetical protein